MSIQYDDQQLLWVIKTKSMDYVLRCDEFGAIQHVYWGRKLSRVEDYTAWFSMSKWSWESEKGNSREELMPWAELNFTEPGLKVLYADGTRDLALSYEKFEIINENSLVLTLRDQLQQVSVKLHYQLFEEFDLVERKVEVANDSDHSVSLEQVMAAVWHLPDYSDYRLTYLVGRWGAETQVRQERLQEGKKVLESRRGNTGHHANPWFAVDFNNANEEQGEVYFGALAFSGNWKIVVEHTPYQTVQVAVGLNNFDFAWELSPGEIFVSPSSIGGYTDQGFGQASRNLHDYERRYVLPDAERHLPVLYNSWEATSFDVTESGQMALAEKAAAMGAELFVVDDGWFAGRIIDNGGLGDWKVDKDKFPNGLTPLIEHTHRLGMQFGLWVEPEMVNPDSDLYRLHPDWAYHFQGRDRTEVRNQLVLNLARSDVQEYLFECLDELLSENNISYLKWDMNRYFSEPGWPGIPVNKQKEIWVRHVQAIYDLWERLQKKHPNVAFESCAGGGGRIDLGIMRYSHQFWISDNTDPLDRLTIQEGYTHAYTTKAMRCWVTDAPNWVNGRKTSLEYRFHSAMMGALGIGLNLNQASSEELDKCNEMILQYKGIRDIIQDGDLYRLHSPRESNYSAVQYVNKDKSKCALFVFLRSQQFRSLIPPIRLRGLDDNALYHMGENQEALSGSALMHRGIKVSLAGDFSSKLMIFDMDIN